MTIISVATVDDCPIFQMGLRDGLQKSGVIAVVAQGATDSDARAISLGYRVDVMLLGLPMASSTPGLLKAIRDISPAIQLVLLASAVSDDDRNAAVSAGVRGYFPREIAVPALIEAVLDVYRGKSCVGIDTPMRPPLSRIGMARHDADRDGAAPMESLNYRESQILTLVCRGMTNAEIGREIKLAPQTVKNYMSGIIEKLQVRNRSGAIMKFMAGQDSARLVAPRYGKHGTHTVGRNLDESGQSALHAGAMRPSSPVFPSFWSGM